MNTIVIPRIVVGTARMGSPLPPFVLPASDRRRALAFLDSIFDLGCNAFDTAASYQIGGTERLIGHWIASRRHRDQLYLISKGAHPYPFVRMHRLKPRAISADLHASLRRLRTDHVDLYLLHRDDEHAPLDPILETLTTFQQQGKLGAWGVSNWSHPRIGALSALARSAGTTLAASSPHFSLVEWLKPPWRGCVSIAGEVNREARAYYEREQLPVLAWAPLGSGFFSSRPGAAMGARSLRTYGGPANCARRQRAEELAKRYGRSPSQIALAYLYSQPFPVCAVVAPTTVEQMTSNVAATAVRLSARELRWLEIGEGTLPS